MLTQTETGSLLHLDHMSTIETLQALDAFIGQHRKAPAMNADSQDFLRKLARTLRDEVERHFGFEENHLFPVFVERGETGIVMMLTQEHRVILPLAVRVADLASGAAESGFSDADWQEFREAGAELAEREIFHVQKEEMGLLAAISALVDPAVDARLAQAYRALAG